MTRAPLTILDLPFVAVCLLSLVMVTSGCAESSTAPPTKIGSADSEKQSAKLSLNWYPEAEHGGYIAGDTLGLFDAAGLNVEIVPGGPGAPTTIIAELAAGRTQFAISDADNVVKARATGLPLVAVLAPLQNSPRCIMVHDSSGITQLEQLANVELAISEQRPFALWMKRKLPLTNVRMVPFNGLVGEFVSKTDFAQQAYSFSEPFLAKEQGSDPKVLMLSEIGFNPYACLLVTTEGLIAEQPELVRKVVQCSAEGWRKYLENPSKVNEAIHGMNKDMSLPALEFGAREMVNLCSHASDQKFGEMSEGRWKELVAQIEELNDIPGSTVKPAECFNNQFVP
ncbi:MAG: ABC transporter substrate-binding protein [Planctomycetota bacterium]